MKYSTFGAYCLIGSLGCSQNAPEQPPLIRSVRYVSVKKTDDVGVRVFSGALEAGNESRLSFQVAGRIQNVAVKEGQRIKKNDLVAELDPTDFRLQLREVEANVAQANAQASNAAADYQRVRRLYETRNTSRQELDASRARQDSSKAAYVAAQETLSRLRRQLSYTRLKAPAEGTVNSVSAEANEVVSPGQVVVVVQAGKSLQAAIDMPESLIRYVGLGDEAEVRVDAVDATVKGVIQEIGVPRAGTGVFPVYIKLSSDPEAARPGMVAEVHLTPKKDSNTADEGFRIPLAALGEDRAGRFVFVLEGEPGQEGIIKRTPVKTGSVTSQGIRITTGLAEGQRIVVAGVSRIKDAMTVRIPKKPAEQGQDF